MNSRHIDLAGCHNVRDLGGLRTGDGHSLRPNTVIRADSLDALTAEAWAELERRGVRTVIDLRHDREKSKTPTPRPASIQTIHISLDGGEDPEFWAIWGNNARFCTAMYFRPHIKRFPEISASVVRAIAQADGAVAYHCGAGRDRTGIVTMLLLLLVGVSHDDIVSDYLISYERLLVDPKRVVEREKIDAFLAKENATLESLMRQALDGLDAEAVLLAAGLSAAEIENVRTRMIDRP